MSSSGAAGRPIWGSVTRIGADSAAQCCERSSERDSEAELETSRIALDRSDLPEVDVFQCALNAAHVHAIECIKSLRAELYVQFFLGDPWRFEIACNRQVGVGVARIYESVAAERTELA